MSLVRQWLYGLGLLGALALAAWVQALRLDAAQARGDQAADQLAHAQTQTRQVIAHANTLARTLNTERIAQTALRATHNQLRQGITEREQQIEGLKHENADLRRWADQLLPGAARRLRQRPAITGAAAYRDWLSGSGAVRPADEPTEH